MREPEYRQLLNFNRIKGRKKGKKMKLGLITIFATALALSCPAKSFPLTENGKTVCCIVLSPNAGPAEKHAAEELAKYLSLTSGGKLPSIGTAKKEGMYPVYLKKIKDEAMAMHRKPVLVVDDGSQKEANTWCLCRRNNIDMTGIIAVDLPFKVKTNITGKGEVLKTNLKDVTKRYIGEFYTNGVYEIEWQGDTVVVMPLATFKELFEK